MQREQQEVRFDIILESKDRVLMHIVCVASLMITGIDGRLQEMQAPDHHVPSFPGRAKDGGG